MDSDPRMLLADEAESVVVEGSSLKDLVGEISALLVSVWKRNSVPLDTFKDFLRKNWRLGQGEVFMEMSTNMLLVSFEDDDAMDKIVQGEPWFFEKQILVMKKLSEVEDLDNSKMHTAPFWIHLKHIPGLCRKRNVAERMGALYGGAKEIDIQGSFVRMKVTLDLEIPLRRGKKLDSAFLKNQFVSFQYENLPSFCYFCGRIGHFVRECDWAPAGVLRSTDVRFKYGNFLRVGSGNGFVPDMRQLAMSTGVGLQALKESVLQKLGNGAEGKGTQVENVEHEENESSHQYAMESAKEVSNQLSRHDDNYGSQYGCEHVNTKEVAGEMINYDGGFFGRKIPGYEGIFKEQLSHVINKEFNEKEVMTVRNSKEEVLVGNKDVDVEVEKNVNMEREDSVNSCGANGVDEESGGNSESRGSDAIVLSTLACKKRKSHKKKSTKGQVRTKKAKLLKDLSEVAETPLGKQGGVQSELPSQNKE